ncbi:hypothetical protein [Prochlorococcus marinus]|nr:hypothetical protein [Prochlorococcus marinus]
MASYLYKEIVTPDLCKLLNGRRTNLSNDHAQRTAPPTFQQTVVY